VKKNFEIGVKMPWVVKTEKESAAAAEEEKPKREKSEGKGGKAKGGDKGGKNGKDDREGEKGGKKGKGKGDNKGSKGDDWGYSGKGDRGGYDSRGYDSQEKGKKGDGKKGGFKGKDDGPPRSKGGDGGKGGKGKGKYDDDRKGDSKGDSKGGKKGAAKGRPRNDSEENIRSERPLRSEDVRRQATAHTGKHCQVRKHSSMGCAVVTLDSVELRQAIKMVFCGSPGAPVTKHDIGGHQSTIRPHADKESQVDIPTDVFIGWGRQTEKNDPLSEQVIADWFDEKHVEFVTTGRLTPQGLGDSEAKRLLAQQTAQKQAQWASAGATPAAARVPGGPLPGGPAPPGANPAANPYALQQQQQQYMAAMQAQYMRAYQQQQAAYYAAAQQAQQQQQAAYMAHLKTQQEAQAAVRNRKAGFKAAYRVPTDDEVQATLQKLAGKKSADAAPEAPAGGNPAAEVFVPAAEAAPANDAAPAAPAADAA